MMKSRTKIVGFNLLELLLALAVVAALALAVTRIYQMVDNSRKVNAAANAVLQVYQAGAQYDVLPNVTDLLAEFISHGYLPNNFMSINPWGGTITAARTSNEIMSVSLSGVPKTSCQNLINKFDNLGTPSCGTGDPTTFSITLTLSSTG